MQRRTYDLMFSNHRGTDIAMLPSMNFAPTSADVLERLRNRLLETPTWFGLGMSDCSAGIQALSLPLRSNITGQLQSFCFLVSFSKAKPRSENVFIQVRR
ncbi:hypothetical protein A5906_04950 [Bradyrhizobium sacchari]|nr:hypothetical protein A5906_04950 [Bradyrhizobium sacchari]